MDQEWLTPTETAALLRVSVQTIYQAIQRGEIPHVRLGRTYRIPRSRLDLPPVRQPHADDRWLQTSYL